MSRIRTVNAARNVGALGISKKKEKGKEIARINRTRFDQRKTFNRKVEEKTDGRMFLFNRFHRMSRVFAQEALKKGDEVTW